MSSRPRTSSFAHSKQNRQHGASSSSSSRTVVSARVSAPSPSAVAISPNARVRGTDGERETERDTRSVSIDRARCRSTRHDATRLDSRAIESRSPVVVVARVGECVRSNMGFLCMSPPECVLQYGFLLYVSSDGRTRPTGGGRRRRRESATRRDETGRDAMEHANAPVSMGVRETRRGEATRDAMECANVRARRA